jgi:serine/threonine protein kinase
MHRFLKVISGPDTGKLVQVSDAFTTLIGRGRHADFQLNDPAVSRVHCEVEIRANRVLLTDLESGAGTLVNGVKVEDAKLKDGDVVQIGDTRMRLEADPNPVEVEETLASSPAIRPRPVLMTEESLPKLVGHKLSHFEITSLLARGQSGLIFKARDFRKDRDVALKVLWPEFTQNESDMARFVRSMKTMLPYRHPNLVAIYGAGKTGPYCWIAMELVEGESLSEVIRRLGVANMLDNRRVFHFAMELAKALEYAHKQGIIHRNLTPQNVLVGAPDDKVKLGDLMLAKALEGGLAEAITKPGEILGDLRFMAPERATGGSDVDARADLFSLGALLYTLLAGRPPFEGKSTVETVTKICTEAPTPPRKINMAVSDTLEKTVMKLLAKRRDERYGSATELIADLGRIAKFSRL